MSVNVKILRVWSTRLILLGLPVSGCQKSDPSNTNPRGNEIKIEIVSGNNQSDTIGYVLEDSIVIKVTRNNVGLGGRAIKVVQPNCGFSTGMYILTDPDGTSRFQWELNGKIGDQAVHFTVYDSAQIPRDSVTAHAQGNFYNNAWQKAYCLPFVGLNDICQSGTGRLFCGLLSFDVPYFSDDKGVNWQRLNSFPVTNKEIRQMVAKGNEIFIATRHDGIYYSPDNGASWQNRSNGITDTREVMKLGITSSGKLLLSTIFKPLFISNDKGLNWISVSSGVDYNDHMTSFCETSTGTLYMVSDDKELYSSTTGGTSWTKVSSTPYWSVQVIFVDDNDDLYIGTYGNTADIYKSGDGGITWTLKHSSPAVPATYLLFKEVFKVNGTYYFMIGGYGVIKTQDFSTFTRITNRYSLEYLVGNDNALYIPGPFENLWYNLNP